MPLDKNEKELLEQINQKLISSKALNGGFDKLVVTVENIKEKQQETSEKLDTITNALYEPRDGLFARVQSIEYSTKTLTDDLSVRRSEIKNLAVKNEKEHEALIDFNKKEHEVLSENSNLSRKLKRIAGSELEELVTVINFKKNVTKIYWSMIGLIVVSMAKLLWELITKH